MAAGSASSIGAGLGLMADGHMAPGERLPVPRSTDTAAALPPGSPPHHTECTARRRPHSSVSRRAERGKPSEAAAYEVRLAVPGV